MRDEPTRDQTAEPEDDTSAAEYLAEDDHTKTTGYNAVPHRAKQPDRKGQVAEARRETGEHAAEPDERD